LPRNAGFGALGPVLRNTCGVRPTFNPTGLDGLSALVLRPREGAPSAGHRPSADFSFPGSRRPTAGLPLHLAGKPESSRRLRVTLASKAPAYDEHSLAPCRDVGISAARPTRASRQGRRRTGHQKSTCPQATIRRHRPMRGMREQGAPRDLSGEDR
jgi:hypothetical protein